MQAGQCVCFSAEALLPKWLHTDVILPFVTSSFAYFDCYLSVGNACFAGTAADINTVALQGAESLHWTVRRSSSSSILCLVGATAALKVGVIQAVAADNNGHIAVYHTVFAYCWLQTRSYAATWFDPGSPICDQGDNWLTSSVCGCCIGSRPTRQVCHLAPQHTKLNHNTCHHVTHVTCTCM